MGSDTDQAAFGSDPGSWPLPAARTPEGLWLRAVAAGGQGRYAAAEADLDRLLRRVEGGPLASLALSTRGSFLRQLGWHDRARSFDGAAWACSGGTGDAAADALIGLAADALGVGRFAASERALRRAAGLAPAATSARVPIRLAWVSAELAMARGDGAALTHAARAVELAAHTPSVRHRVKSLLVRAAAHCASGDIDAARADGDRVLAWAGEQGLVPLRWAAAALLAGIGSGEHSVQQVTDIRRSCAETVTRRGGVWRSR
ncbi:hypothetical protein FK535_21380 [Mycolicibacterium sp. 018/SC-01/001]|uniref:hypothetical protein n=1 Tax=Mycolicibacterium sp. 018/SC-01/001 TaxID=2592069 RepID=UPI00117E4E58|nr:hypothetical protein [Mycolicibacterium sp. 018/SC-01/001]TRW79889.1 hypothetical protein FK535_21380 [Mycolicibacterium sp. 018/SC-01/001]